MHSEGEAIANCNFLLKWPHFVGSFIICSMVQVSRFLFALVCYLTSEIGTASLKGHNHWPHSVPCSEVVLEKTYVSLRRRCSSGVCVCQIEGRCLPVPALPPQPPSSPGTTPTYIHTYRDRCWNTEKVDLTLWQVATRSVAPTLSGDSMPVVSFLTLRANFGQMDLINRAQCKTAIRLPFSVAVYKSSCHNLFNDRSKDKGLRKWL